jgi:uracil-DNA glycosylase family 4
MSKIKVSLPLVADPTEASADHALCLKCGLFASCNLPFMPAYVPAGWTGLILVVGEAPGKDEDQLGRPFVGRAGQALYNMFEAAGIKREDVALTNANRCRPEANAAPTMAKIRLCRPFVVHDIRRLQPKWVLCLGVNALKSVLDEGTVLMSDCRQRVLEHPDFSDIRITATWHPASTLYKDGKERAKQIAEDLQWLMSFRGYVDGPEKAWPDHDGPAVALDLEFDGAKYVTLGLAWGNKANSHEEPLTTFEPSRLSYCAGHNVHDDIAIAQANGATIPREWITGEKVLDSMMLARLYDENLNSYGLEDLAVSMLNIKPWKKPTEDIGVKCLEWPTELRMERCRLDAWASAKLVAHLTPKLDKTLTRFSHRLAAALHRVEMTGNKISPETFGKVRKLLCKELGSRAFSLMEVAKKNGFQDKLEFSNDNHMRKLLFEIMQMEPQKLTDKTKEPAVDRTALVLLYQILPSGHPARDVVAARLKYEKLEKLVSTYVVGVDKRLSLNGFLFPSINALGARTGRRSQSDPNLQNWPKKMRQMIVSRWAGGRLVSGDFSQLEPRILAEHAGIEAWQEMFRKGKSLYIESAKMLWKRDIEKDDKYYKMTKSTILGTNYGMEVDLFVEKLATEQGVRLSRSDGEYVLGLYHRTFPALPRFFALQKERILAHGRVTNTAGQTRHLPCPEGERTKGFKHMWNQAVNFPIQGDAALISGSALLDLESALLAEFGVELEDHYSFLVNWWAHEKKNLTWAVETDNMELWRHTDYPVIMNEVHDELLADAPNEQVANKTKEIMKGVMEQCPTLRRLWPRTKDWVLAVDPKVLTRWE